jgi:signal peptidase II
MDEDGPSSRAPWLRAGLTLGAVVGLDQLSKALVRRSVDVGSSDGIFPGVELVHVRNHGVAFSLGSGQAGLVIAGTVVVLAVLVLYFARHPQRHGLWLPTGLLVGGAAGNLLDRLASGAVTDFLKIPLWPAFNLADVAITVGVLALLWVLEGPRRSPATTP